MGIGSIIWLPFILQIPGLLYPGFAMLNLKEKANIMWGIYSRPVTMGNFMHIVVGWLAMLKGFFTNPVMKIILIPTIIYLVFAFMFGWVLFGHPGNKDHVRDKK
jgi:hypothetical protein